MKPFRESESRCLLESISGGLELALIPAQCLAQTAFSLTGPVIFLLRKTRFGAILHLHEAETNNTQRTNTGDTHMTTLILILALTLACLMLSIMASATLAIAYSTHQCTQALTVELANTREDLARTREDLASVQARLNAGERASTLAAPTVPQPLRKAA